MTAQTNFMKLTRRLVSEVMAIQSFLSALLPALDVAKETAARGDEKWTAEGLVSGEADVHGMVLSMRMRGHGDATNATRQQEESPRQTKAES